MLEFILLTLYLSIVFVVCLLSYKVGYDKGRVDEKNYQHFLNSKELSKDIKRHIKELLDNDKSLYLEIEDSDDKEEDTKLK